VLTVQNPTKKLKATSIFTFVASAHPTLSNAAAAMIDMHICRRRTKSPMGEMRSMPLP
jgi:hypothetical protein